MLQVGMQAPAFTLADKDGKMVSLSDFLGKKVVLYFYPKYNLPFILLSDPELQAIQAYGVWQEKKLYGKTSMGIVRTTFLIDEQGKIMKVMPKVKPDTNAAEVLEIL